MSEPTTQPPVEVGDFVFVDPRTDVALLQLRGFDGTVIAIDGDEAHVELGSGESLRIQVSLLRRNRRRKRRPVSWGSTPVS